MNFIDCHSHSTFSPDGANSVIEMCDQAKTLGLKAYSITDHCEANRFHPLEYYNISPSNNYDTYNFVEDFNKSMDTITNAKERYKGKLNLICGIELGQATHDTSAADIIVNDKRLDFIIASQHQIHGYDDFAFMSYSKDSIPPLLTAYYNELLTLCKWNKFDVIGHLTYTLRYIQGIGGIPVDMSPYEEKIRECLAVLAKNGRGIEINTSGLRQKSFGSPFPELYYVKMFKEVGGEILSIGSDSHSVNDIGKGIECANNIALAAGFKYICYFKERIPNFVSIC